MGRHDGRRDDALRQVTIKCDVLEQPFASVMIEMGRTKVLCCASVEDRVPGFLVGQREGWVTAEYGMLPASTGQRMRREVERGKASGRTMEIQRLIGRALRSVVRRRVLGERTIWIDCDVLQADGGTRTASITGAFVAMALALDRMKSTDFRVHQIVQHIPDPTVIVHEDRFSQALQPLNQIPKRRHEKFAEMGG